MAQTKIKVDSGFQDMLVKLVKRNDIHAEMLFAFMNTTTGIEPVIVVADDVPSQKEVIKMLYEMLDAIYGFKNVHVLSGEQFEEFSEESRKLNLEKDEHGK